MQREIPLNATERSVIGAKNRRKGLNFERRVKDQFQEWWSPGKEFKFMRNDQKSDKVAFNKAFKLTGDIICTDNTFPLHIECKYYDDFDLYSEFHKPALILTAMNQAIKDSTKDKVPVVIIGRHRYPSLCIFDLSRVRSSFFPHIIATVDTFILVRDYFIAELGDLLTKEMYDYFTERR